MDRPGTAGSSKWDHRGETDVVITVAVVIVVVIALAVIARAAAVIERSPVWHSFAT